MANFKDLTDSLDEQNRNSQQAQEKAAQLGAVNDSGDKVAKAVAKGSEDTVKALGVVKGEVSVTNPDLAKSQDVNQAVEAINKLNLTTFMQNEGLPKLAENLADLSSKTQDLQEKVESEGLKKLSDQLTAVVKKLDDVAKVISKTEVSVDAKLQKTIDNLSQSISKIDFNPSVNVSAPDTKVVTTPVNLTPLVSGLNDVKQAILDSEKEETEQDLTPITSGLTAVENAIQALRFPVPNYVLPYVDKTGKATQAKTFDGSIAVVNPDGSNIAGGSGGSGTQYTDGGVPPAHPIGGAIEWSDGSNWQTASTAKPLPVSVQQSTPGNLLDVSYSATDAIYNGTTALTPKFAVITASSSGATTIVSAVTSKRIRVLQFGLMGNGIVNVKFQSHVTPTDLTGLLYLIANTGMAAGYSPVGLFQTVAGEALDINLSANIAVGGFLSYIEV